MMFTAVDADGRTIKLASSVNGQGVHTLTVNGITGGGGEGGGIASEVAITNFPEVQNVFGPLTDEQLRAAALPVTGPLTDAQLRAAAVPVSGPLTDAQLRAAALPVSLADAPLPTGAATAAKQDTIVAAINGLTGVEYETVAAAQTSQALGATGAVGDLLVSLLVIPTSTAPGAIQIKDGSGSEITVFAGGEDSLSTLHPFTISLGVRSTSGAWQVTTGADVSVIATGNFT